jgi:cyclopropane fatty-acyl-phospholipid synthase-like methyltransferase
MATGDRPRTAVSDYYDANTWKFLLTGSGRAIHRELWGPGVTSRGEALHHTHALVLDQLGAGDRRVLDLGCGVGTAALYLARRRPVEVVGVSISPTQVRLAERFAARDGPLQGSVRFAVADFTTLPTDLTGFDLAFAIESFVHANPAAAFFDQAARALRAGGALVIVDDVRNGDRDEPALDDFRAGWHAPSVLSVAEAEALAADAGLALVASEDLSALQRPGRPRDRFIHAILPLLRRLRSRSAWARSLVGGDALQHCHRTGLLEYRMLRFERTTASSGGELSRR